MHVRLLAFTRQEDEQTPITACDFDLARLVRQCSPSKLKTPQRFADQG